MTNQIVFDEAISTWNFLGLSLEAERTAWTHSYRVSLETLDDMAASASNTRMNLHADRSSPNK